jgi:acid phosphatase (class A)
VHYLSDVEAGYTSAAGLVAVLHSSPAFEVDMKAAGAELVRLRKSAAAPDASSCGAERAVLYSPGW